MFDKIQRICVVSIDVMRATLIYLLFIRTRNITYMLMLLSILSYFYSLWNLSKLNFIISFSEMALLYQMGFANLTQCLTINAFTISME